MNDKVTPFPQREPLVALKREERYSGALPKFFKPEWFPELQPLTDNWQAIRNEIFEYEKQHGLIKGLDKKRYVLVVDFVPAFMEQSKMTACTKLLGTQSYNYLEKRFTVLEHLPNWAANFMCFCIALGWRVYLPIQRSVKFL